MKSHTQYLTLNVPARMDFVNITGAVESAVLASGVREGLCLVNAMHITASVFINDDAHHKRQLMGREVVVAVTGGPRRS
jgi:thiamine phosphate synthase YjbQ (UPF0047 family)